MNQFDIVYNTQNCTEYRILDIQPSGYLTVQDEVYFKNGLSAGKELIHSSEVDGKNFVLHPQHQKACSWCGSEILTAQPTSKSYDGETMHFDCAAKCDDADIGDCSSS